MDFDIRYCKIDKWCGRIFQARNSGRLVDIIIRESEGGVVHYENFTLCSKAVDGSGGNCCVACLDARHFTGGIDSRYALIRATPCHSPVICVLREDCCCKCERFPHEHFSLGAVKSDAFGSDAIDGLEAGEALPDVGCLIGFQGFERDI